MPSSGWIKLHRKLLDNPLWTQRRKFSRAEAWIDLLFMARWDEEPTTVLIDGRPIECRYGECLRSQRTLADRWGWSLSAVHRFLGLLKKLGQIEWQTETVTTRITICNYGTYQNTRNDVGTHVERARNARETHVETEEEVKKGKSGKNKTNAVVFPSSLDTPAFKTAWSEWEAHRKEIRKKLTPRSVELQLKECERMGVDRAVAMIYHTIKNGWTGLREEKTFGRNNQQTTEERHAEAEAQVARIAALEAQSNG